MCKDQVRTVPLQDQRKTNRAHVKCSYRRKMSYMVCHCLKRKADVTRDAEAGDLERRSIISSSELDLSHAVLCSKSEMDFVCKEPVRWQRM